MKRIYKTIRREGEIYIKIEKFKFVEKWFEHLVSHVEPMDKYGDLVLIPSYYNKERDRNWIKKHIYRFDLKHYLQNSFYITNLTYYKLDSYIVEVPCYFHISRIGPKNYVVGYDFITGDEKDIEEKYTTGKLFCDLGETIKNTKERTKKVNYTCLILERYCHQFGFEPGKYLLELVDLE